MTSTATATDSIFTTDDVHRVRSAFGLPPLPLPSPEKHLPYLRHLRQTIAACVEAGPLRFSEPCWNRYRAWQLVADMFEVSGPIQAVIAIDGDPGDNLSDPSAPPFSGRLYATVLTATLDMVPDERTGPDGSGLTCTSFALSGPPSRDAVASLLMNVWIHELLEGLRVGRAYYDNPHAADVEYRAIGLWGRPGPILYRDEHPRAYFGHLSDEQLMDVLKIRHVDPRALPSAAMEAVPY